MKKIRNNIQHNSLLRYLLIGGLAFITDYGVLLLTYYVFSFNLSVATSLGYITGLGVSFISNRQWVFGEKGSQKHVFHQSAQYVALFIFNYFVTVFGVHYLNKQGIKPYVGKVLMTGLIVCWNYILFKKIIFVANQPED